MASKYGVARFIYISSIKVNGEQTLPNSLFKSDDDFSTNDPYGISKYEAEQALLNLAEESGMEVVIIRPPLVYGPKVKANFDSLVNWVKKGIPLPFGSVENKRSFIALDNLVDFILLCADRARSPNATNQVFLISDNEDISTATLIERTLELTALNHVYCPCLYRCFDFLLSYWVSVMLLIGCLEIFRLIRARLVVAWLETSSHYG